MTGRALKIVHVEAGRHLYGGALQVFYLLRGLSEVKNILVCPQDSAIATAAADFAQVYALPMRGDFDLPFIWRLRAIIKREKPDLVHLHSRRGADTLGGLAAWGCGVPVVLTRRVDNPESPGIVKFKYRLYDRVITISQGIREVLLKEGVPAQQVQCVPSAVDFAKYNLACQRDWFGQEFAVAPHAKVVGVIAQLIERKGHRYLLAVIPQVLAQFPETKFIFFGQGPLAAVLRAEIAAPRYQNAVHLAGFRPDLDKILPCLYAVVHPAEMEGLGVSLLQAAAAGVPIIGTCAGGIPEIVRDGVNGLLVPPADSAALAHALLEILREPQRAQAMGQAGKSIAQKEFSIEAMVAGNKRVYQDILS